MASSFSGGNDFQMPWFHGNITREKAEKLLGKKGDGTFLIRNSTNFPGNFTLCISYKGKVEHYRIYLKNKKFSCDNEVFFDNLTQLVSHYKREADGLCHRLVAPLVSEESILNSKKSSKKFDVQEEFKRANLLVNKSELKFGEIIGYGEFGNVLMGFYKLKHVAIKTLKNGPVDDLLREARFMINLNHIHLISLVGVVIEDIHGAYILTEYMANGNLVDYLRSRGRQMIERLQLMNFALNVADGMCYMESHNFVHRDLAARNILLDSNLVAKISDFGLAQVAFQPTAEAVKAPEAKGRFPIKWTAPEALNSNVFTSKSDVWSFGILLWEIFSFGRVPYPGIPVEIIFHYIEIGNRNEPPEECPKYIIALMHDSWQLDPQLRPTFHDISSTIKHYIDNNSSL